MAEGEGFEPPVRFPVHRFSRPTVSTAHTSLRGYTEFINARGRVQRIIMTNYHITSCVSRLQSATPRRARPGSTASDHRSECSDVSWEPERVSHPESWRPAHCTVPVSGPVRVG